MPRIAPTPESHTGNPKRRAPGLTQQLPSVNKRVWRVSLAGGAGSAIEYYDFSLYANMAIFLSPLFFAGMNSTAAMLNTLAVFGSGFLMRPVGAVFFGWLGDTRGRRAALLGSVLTMGVASAATGLLPTFDNAGLLAPVLLTLTRLVQGFCAGGEASGAATYIAENSPARLRGFFGAFTPAGIAIGTATAGGLAALCSFVLTDDQMHDFGWRIPFLMSLPLALVCVVLRRSLPEAPRPATAAAKRAVSPLRHVLSAERSALLKVVCVVFAVTCTAYVGHVYLNVHLTTVLGQPQTLSLTLNSVITVVAACCMPFAAYASDRWGRRRVFGLAMAGYAVLTLPMFLLMAVHNAVVLGAAMAVSFVPWIFAQAIGYPLMTELFSGTARYTGVALGFGIGSILGGGFGPYVAGWLTSATGWSLAPALYMVVTAVIGAVALRTVGASRIEESEGADRGE
ncbi:Proline_betaine transporter [Streptomyces sp. enrichment culture]|uniref:MFS transporter n=1 Tax=Streptomyces sp. enrichment culture TaxID=1795815 RepID=UPI003F563F4E